MNDASTRKSKTGPRAEPPRGAGSVPGRRTVPGSNLPLVATAEEALRVLEEGPDSGFLLVNARALKEGLKTFLDRADAGTGRASDTPVFTPRHLDILFGDLTRNQRLFLMLLLQSPGQLVTKQELAREIAGGSGELQDYHSLNQTAHLLRKKLGPAGRCIETVHGTGFRWNRKMEPKSLTRRLFKVAGLAALALLAVVAGVVCFLPDGQGDPETRPFKAMRPAETGNPPGEPSASVVSAAVHSPWKAVDGSDSTWFESVGPARAGDWFMLRLAADVPASRIEIRCGRPDTSNVPPCRVECATGDPGSLSWISLGTVDPATGRFSATFPDAPVSAIRLVVEEDSDLPLAIAEWTVE